MTIIVMFGIRIAFMQHMPRSHIAHHAEKVIHGFL